MSARGVENPEIGLFRVRQRRGGPWVPARIHQTCHCTIGGVPHPWEASCDRYPHLKGEIDGSEVDALKVWNSGQPITQGEYDYLTADRAHLRLYDPDRLDAATPAAYFRVDLMKPIF